MNVSTAVKYYFTIRPHMSQQVYEQYLVESWHLSQQMMCHSILHPASRPTKQTGVISLCTDTVYTKHDTHIHTHKSLNVHPHICTTSQRTNGMHFKINKFCCSPQSALTLLSSSVDATQATPCIFGVRGITKP